MARGKKRFGSGSALAAGSLAFSDDTCVEDDHDSVAHNLTPVSADAETLAAVAPVSLAPLVEQITLSAGRGRKLSAADVAAKLASAGAVRPLNTAFEKDTEKWKLAEKAFVANASAELHKLVNEFAGSEESWRELLKIYARAPHYSITNLLYAWGALHRKGVRGEGMILSESGWKALGHEIKPEFKRVWRKLKEDGTPDWDDTYAAEMLAPIRVNKKAAEGAVTPSGDPERDRSIVIGWKTFDVYHEDAVQLKAGQAELPKPSWFEATGSDEDAAKLWADVEKLCEWQGLELTVDAPRAQDANRPGLPGAALASYDRGKAQVRVHRSANLADQASAALGAVCEHFGPETPAKDDIELMRRVVARESAKFALASLYGLASEHQSFTYLSEIAADEKAVKQVTNDVHKRVSAVLAHLDPVLKMKARGETEMNAHYDEVRKAKRKTQTKKKRRSTRISA